MLSVKLPILFHSETTSALSKLDIDYDIEDCDERQMIFYRIDALSAYQFEKDGFSKVIRKEFTCIHSNGSEFICPMDMQTTHEKIQERL